MQQNNLDKTIARINELSKLSRERELTAEEQQERAALRQEYITSFRRNLESQLDTIYFVDDKGNKSKLKKKD